MFVAVGHPRVWKLHGGVQLGGGLGAWSVEGEGMLPRDGVRHWAREL